jgi:hypothetical protein
MDPNYLRTIADHPSVSLESRLRVLLKANYDYGMARMTKISSIWLS